MKLIPTSTNPVTLTLYRNFPFDNSYRETALLSRRFTYNGMNVGADNNSFLDLKDSSNNYYFPRTTKTGTYNFAFGNGLVTSLILELTDEEINTNYIKVECAITHDIYYYFVTDIVQKNELTYMISLELDVFMTYGDSFLEVMNDIPVMTERKHCYRVTPTGQARCTSLMKADSNFSGVKANLTEKIIKLVPSILDDDAVNMKTYNWCYVIVKIDEQSYDYAYKENNVIVPYAVICFPLVTLKFKRLVGGVATDFVTIDPMNSMKFWATRENVYKISILPFPPFSHLGNNKIYEQDDEKLSLLIDNSNITQVGNDYDVIINGDTKFRVSPQTHSYCAVLNGFGGKMYYENFKLFEESELTGEPSINLLKDKFELALYLPPFKQYKLRTFADEGVNFNPQLRLTQYYDYDDWKRFYPVTIVSTNPDNTSYFTSVLTQDKEIENKIGLATNYYYSMPTSYTALQHFLNTASAEYNNSKLINGLNAIATMGMGGMAVSNANKMGQIAGAGAIMTGVIKEIDNITSYFAKMEDLKNTPANLTTGGSTYTLDNAMSLSTNLYMLPFVTIFSVDNSIKQCASDFFYHYGYEVNRECYFNTNLYRDYYNATETNLFTRTLFNYVKLSENITTKLVGKIPYTIAKKFAEVLMNGIEIWNFFGFTTLQNKVNASGVYDVFRYFHKCTYSNAEFYNQSY